MPTAAVLKFLKKLVVICCIFNASVLHAQPRERISFWQPAPEPNPQRIRLLAWSLGGAYALSMTGLYQLWYKDYELGKFHFFNDNDEWLQLDKAGHIAATYYVGKWGISLFDWTGMDHKKAIWMGGSLGLAFMTTVEIFDGFSNAWGFSTGDMMFNLSGSALLISQQLLWDEQRITFKLSYHRSEFAHYRPDQFGTTFPERLVKDYNGHSIWFSGNIFSFMKNKESRFPKWLNLAAGYGVDGLTGALENVSEYNGKPVPEYERQRQFYLSPDVDLTRISTRSKFLKSVFNTFGFIKIPAPALELKSSGTLRWHWLYF